MSNKYHLHCVVCTEEFEVTRRDAHTCSDTCRLALSNMYKKMKEDTSGLTEEELKTYKKLQARIEGKGSTLRTITGTKKSAETEEEETAEESSDKEESEEENDK